MWMGRGQITIGYHIKFESRQEYDGKFVRGANCPTAMFS